MSDKREAFASYTHKPKTTNTTTNNNASSTTSLPSGSMRGSTSLTTSANLANIVVSAAESSRKINKSSSNIAQLRLTNMNLHGRSEEIKLLRGKLREMVQKKKRLDAEKATALAENSNGEDGDSPQAPTPTDKGEDENVTNNNNNLILVTGKSGTGKSSLITKGLGEPSTKIGFLFAKGKFDQNLRPRPLSAFADAMSNLCRYIDRGASGGKLGLAASLIREDLQSEFDEEGMDHLRSALPGCVGLFDSAAGEDTKRRQPPLAMPSLCEVTVPMVMERGVSFSSLGSTRRRSSSTAVMGTEAVIRTHFAIRKLLKIICSHVKGVVLFIDDLQWGDNATLELLRSIVLDKEIPSLLIVGAYREDEVPDHLPLASLIEDLEHNVTVTQLNIGNLDADAVKPFVADALGMDEDDTKIESLGEIVHKKTEGNPFFVTIFLTSLYDDKILQYNFGSMKWTWDDELVESKIVTDNVASVLVNKMARLRDEAQRMLMVASCLGGSFKLSAISEVMKNMSDGEIRSSMRSSSVSFSLSELDPHDSFISRDGSSDSSVASSIKEFEEEGLVEVDNDNCYFVHDQIQSAAFDLIEPEQRNSFQGKIGNILLSTLSSDELDENLFDVVSLLNCSESLITDEERAQAAKLNLKAGKKASENGAFDAAKNFYNAGRDALGSTGWEDHPKLMLDLCSDGANACFVTGDVETMNNLIDEVLSKDIATTDKYRVTEIKAKSLHALGKPDESIAVALDFRRQLGLPLSKRKPGSTFSILKTFIKVKKMLKNKSAEDIANLPELDDERVAMGQRLNELLVIDLMQCEPTMLPLIIFNMVTTTLKHGLNATSCDAFARLGLLLCGPFGKPHEGREMAKAAELILQQPGMHRITSKTIFVTHSFCFHWTAPLHDTIAPLLKGCEEGLAAGDVDSACYCIVARCFNLYYVGRPLDSTQQELEATIDVMTQVRQDGPVMRIVIIEATVKKLRGLDTEADDEKLDSYVKTAEETGNLSLFAFVYSMKLEVCVFFQQWESALESVQKAGDVRLALPALSNSIRFTFLEALTYLKVAQTATGSKKKKMKKSGKKVMKLIQGWAKNGNVNVVHHLQILEAELAVLEGKVKKAEESFKAAVASARRNGFIQDRALAHELSAALFESQGDDYWKNYHLECAKTCYQEWGCNAKVEQFN